MGGGSKKLFPPQGSAPWGGSKIFPLQGSAPWGGSRLQIFRPEGGASERKSMDLDCCGAARRRQKIFGTFLCPYTFSPSFSSLFDVRKCYFLKENECLGELDSQNFLVPPSDFGNCPPMVGGKFSGFPPQGMPPWGAKLPPQGSAPWGGSFSENPIPPPTMGGKLDPWSRNP